MSGGPGPFDPLWGRKSKRTAEHNLDEVIIGGALNAFKRDKKPTDGKREREDEDELRRDPDENRLSDYSLEIATVVVPLLLWIVLAFKLHSALWASVILGGVLAMIAVVPFLRRRITNAWVCARVTREWEAAVVKAGAAPRPTKWSGRKFAPTGPEVVGVKRVFRGEDIMLDARKTGGLGEIEKHAPEIEEFLGVQEVIVKRDRRNKSHARVVIIRREPFDDPTPSPWPNLEAASLSLWDEVPLGRTRDDEEITVLMPERNILVAGEPGAGKSVAESLFLATGALDPPRKGHGGTIVYGLDAKGLDMEPMGWTRIMDLYAGENRKDAIKLLETLRARLTIQRDKIRSLGARKITRDMGLPIHLLVVDELAEYLNAPKTKSKEKSDAETIGNLMRSIGALGRAVGFVLCLATQKPHGDLVDTNLRDLIGFRCVGRMGSRAASDTALGDDQSGRGFNAAEIEYEWRGVMYYRVQGRDPVLGRGHYLSDEQIGTIIDRAVKLRQDVATLRFRDKHVTPLNTVPRRPLPVLTQPPSPTPPTPPPARPKVKAVDARRDQDRRDLIAAVPRSAWITRAELEVSLGRPHRQWGPVLKALISEGLMDEQPDPDSPYGRLRYRHAQPDAQPARSDPEQPSD